MKRLVEWFVDNPVAANLLMILMGAGGVLSLVQMKEEMFPDISPPIITVSVPYPGATPEEVEDTVTIRIEEAVHDIEDVKRVTSGATENLGAVTIELEQDVDPDDVVDEVKTRVDAIQNFPPEQAEKPVIQKVEFKQLVLNVGVSGHTDEHALKRLAERIRDEIASLKDVSQVLLANARPYEMSIEVSEDALRRYGLTFDEVARAVRRSSVDLPGGTIKAESGQVLLRTEGKARSAEEFGRIPIRTLEDGSRLLVRDVARVVDGFEESDVATRLNGKPTMILQVFRVGDQGVLGIAERVMEYVRERQGSLPEGITLTIYGNQSRFLRGRMDLLVRNAFYGLALVLLLLVAFFRVRLAFWVGFGMALAFLGAIWLLPVVDVSINLLSLFAFIVVLGILVDDAIVVGENVYRHNQMGKPAAQAAKDGTWEVIVPVTLAVASTIAAFIPMLTIPGIMGDFASEIPKVVILCLIFSLVESLLVLPNHLSHLRTRGKPPGWAFWTPVQDALASLLERFVRSVYRPVLAVAVRVRYVTIALGVATLLITFGLWKGEFIRWRFFPAIEGDYAVVFLTLPLGTSIERTDAMTRRIEAAAERLKREYEGDAPGSVFRLVAATVGAQPVRGMMQQNSGNPQAGGFDGSHLGEIYVELVPSEERTREIDVARLMERWKILAGEIPDAEELEFSSDMMSRGTPINIQLTAPDMAVLRRAADELKEKLRTFPDTRDLSDSYREGKPEIRLTLKPAAEAAGITEADLARQIRQGYYGEETQRVTRGREDMKVMVRYPRDERRSLADVERIRIRASGGVEVPLGSVADVRFARKPATIQRSDRRRSLTVTADINPKGKLTEDQIIANLEENFLPGLLRRYRGLRYTHEGQQRQQRESLAGIFDGLAIALILIYALLAVPLRSYLQPVIIMMAIPFGVTGAVWAHFFLGLDVTFMSLIGILALMGVVVNDSLIMLDFINRRKRDGSDPLEAVMESGPIRFRPILITSLTTFAGLTPMLLERSMQARFLIPMAVSLAFGVLFATGIILLLVPCGYLALEDLRSLFQRRRREPPAPPSLPEPHFLEESPLARK